MLGPAGVIGLLAAGRKLSLLRRWSVYLLVLFLCSGVVSLAVGAGSAFADSWTVEGGTHYLKASGGELIKSWTASEWRVWRKEVQAVGECMGVAEHCAVQELAGETPVEDVPALIADDAQAGVERLRKDPWLNGEVQNTLDLAGEDAGTLPLDLGVGAVASAERRGSGVTLGVELGNGLVQLVQAPAWHPLSTTEERELGEKYGETVYEPEIRKWYEQIADNTEGRLEREIEYTYPPGVYLQGAGGGGAGIYETQEQCEGFTDENPCVGRHTVVTQNETGFLPPHFELKEHLSSESDYEGFHSEVIDRFGYLPPARCPTIKVSSPGEVGASGTPEAAVCPPSELPAPGLLTAEIEANDAKVGLVARPKEASPVTLPTNPPSLLNEGDLRAISENTLGRENIEGMFSEKAREEREVAEREEALYGSANLAEPLRGGCHKGKPVNCATGNQFESQTDLSVGGRGPALKLTLNYNSQLALKQTNESAAAGPFGFGWTGSYSAHLALKNGGTEATVYQDNGSTATFLQTGSSWSAYPSRLVQATLAGEGSGYAYTLPDQTVLHFNSSGQLTSEVDRNGNTLTMTRNTEGRLEAIKDTAGREITLKYNSGGQVESASDPMGHTVKYTYESGTLATVTLPGETAANWQYKYNSSHELTSETDGRGNASTTEYNTSGQVIAETDALHRTRKWFYTPTFTGTETTITEPNGSSTVEQFNETGSPTSVTNAAGTPIASTTTDAYNGADELLTSTNPDGHKTEYGYDAAGDQASEKNPDGDETKWEYNSTHDVTAITTPAGEKTTIERDSHGNALKVSRPAPGETTQATKYKYDADGDVESMTDPLGHEWKYEYDSYGDRKAETDPEANKRTWEYNEDSQEMAEVSPRGNASGAKASEYTTKTERDLQGRPLKITDPLGHTTKYTYDKDGNVETVTDGNSHTTKYTYDADDELTKTEEPNKTLTETGYDSMGQVTTQTDGNKHVTKYVRNALEEVEERVNPLGKKTLEEYDAAGNLTKLTDPAKRTTSYTYDPAGQLTEVSYSSGKPATVKYEYNKDGDRTKMTDGTGTASYMYDQLDRMTETENGHKETSKYEYNLANQQTKITYPNGKAVERSYDKDNRLEKITDWASNITKFTYNPDSELATTVFPSASKDEDKYVYNDADQLTEVKIDKSTEVLASLAYTRDNDGQVKKTTSKGLPGTEVTENTYDENNRLTKYGSTEYKYDSANNPTTEGSSTNTYNEGDELEKGTAVKYTYDELGERTKTTPEKGPATTYGYDQASNLTSVERPKEGETTGIKDTYTYNGENLRTSQTISGTTSYLTWDMTEELPLILNDGTNSYIYGPSNLPTEQISSGGTVTYLHHDQAGSTRLLTGSTGAVTGKCTYSAYGTPTCEGTMTTPLGYDAQYTSQDTGLIYMRNRVYDPSTAQFLTVDPLEAISGEPYAYTGDDPVNREDAVGLLWTPVAGGAGGADAVCGATVEIPGVDIGTCGAAGIATGAAAVGAAIGVVTAVAGNEGGDEGEAELKEHEQESTDCTANQIANGHAFEKHAGEFGAETPEEFEQAIKDALENATKSRELSNGRTAYYDEESNTVVIVDTSSPDGGTIFKPEAGESYFGTLK